MEVLFVETINYELYQIANIEKCHYAFKTYNIAKDYKFSLKDYNKVYSGSLFRSLSETITDHLERLFTIFNLQHPVDFRGHSLSVSDVVKIDGRYFYCDLFGWKEILN